MGVSWISPLLTPRCHCVQGFLKKSSTSTINFQRVPAVLASPPLIGGPIQVRQPPCSTYKSRGPQVIASHRHFFPSYTVSIYTMSDKVNYADFFGFESVAGAAIFAVAYVPLFAWFLRQSFQRPTYVFIVLTFFCASKLCPVLIPVVLYRPEIFSSHCCFHNPRRIGRVRICRRDPWSFYRRPGFVWCWFLWASIFRLHTCS
jgi:hypothetical protein